MRCNNKFYLKRQSEHDWPAYTQSMAAAVGSAFDAFVKADLAIVLGRDDEHLTADSLLDSSVIPRSARQQRNLVDSYSAIIKRLAWLTGW